MIGDKSAADPLIPGSDLETLNQDVPRAYHRYHIETIPAPDVAPYPSRFRVRVAKAGLARVLLREFVHHPLNSKVITSRPCVYGVFSGPVGGFAPREKLCVGCLRCMTEHPDIVQISSNPERQLLGDSYFTPQLVDAVTYEAQTGKIPVKGAGYRGKFGGDGWDGMWTDMSEIVRPTRDGIHGREFISTVVDVGEKYSYLTFDERGMPAGPKPQGFSLPLPILFDLPPLSLLQKPLVRILVQSARELGTLVVLPLSQLKTLAVQGQEIVPLITPEDHTALPDLTEEPLMIELASWDNELHEVVRRHFPTSIACLRLDFASGFEQQILSFHQAGIQVFHLVADYHGRSAEQDFILDTIRRAHQTLVEAGCRDQVTLIAGGGIIAAEHVPKAIICGLDLVAVDTPLLVALQMAMAGECIDRSRSRFIVPDLALSWGLQRLKNLLASWRDQLLEVMGAMGLREVRRLRGEMGRAMFQKDLEREAFGGITGYEEA
jgi:hypothetical protein